VRLLQLFKSVFDGSFLVRRQFVAKLRELLFSTEDEGVSGVLQVDLLFALLVFGSMSFCLRKEGTFTTALTWL
jgi:hypothetical protein